MAVYGRLCPFMAVYGRLWPFVAVCGRPRYRLVPSCTVPVTVCGRPRYRLVPSPWPFVAMWTYTDVSVRSDYEVVAVAGSIFK